MNDITSFPPERSDDPRKPLARIGGGTALATAIEPEKAPHHFDVNEAWRILMKWRWLIVGTLIASIAIAIIVTVSTTPIYRSTATLQINTEPLQVMSQQQQSEVQPVSRDEATFLATQIGLLSSRTLAERVMRTLNLADNDGFVKGYSNRGAREGAAVGKLMLHLEVTPLKGSTLIMIGYSDPNPALAARIINAFAQGFIDSSLERNYQATAFARQFLQSRLDATRTKLEASERALVTYARSQNILSLGSGAASTSGGTGGDSSSSQDSLSAQSLISYNEALSSATRDRIAAEQAFRQGALSASAAAQSSPTVTALRGQLAQVQADYQQKLGTFRPDYPEMTAMRQRMDAINASIASEQKKLVSAQMDTLRSAYTAARGRESQLQGQVNSYRSNVLDLRNRGIQYNILQRDLDTNRSIYDALLQRFKEIGAASGIGESQAVIVDNGIAPTAPYVPNVFINLAIGLLAGLIIGLGTAFAIEFIDDTIKTPDDVINKLKIPVLGVVPRITKGMTFLEELKDQRSEVSEAYYTVMSSVQFIAGSSFPRTALVTSTRPSEGKSSSSLALAQNLARVGASVVLVDMDMRKPSFKTNLPEEMGLATLLMSNGNVMEHVATTALPNLSLMPSGPVPPNPAELLATPRINTIIAELSTHFDIVLIDSPPVLGFADVPVLSAICEATILVVEAGSVRRPAALSSLRRLLAANGHVVGAVLTKYNPHNGGYGYGYGYSYYGYGNGYGRKAQRYGENAQLQQLDLDQLS
jgi:capsular exopolysaccharide synthesis family protein